MSDVNQELQIEVLAQHLKKNGIACSFDEAKEKAKSMINTETKEREPDEQLQILEQRYKFMLNSQKNKLYQEIENLKNSLSSVMSELRFVKQQLNQQKQQQAVVVEKPKEEVKEVREESNAGEKEEQQKSCSGELNPDDFAVDKIFYCGQK